MKRINIFLLILCLLLVAAIILKKESPLADRIYEFCKNTQFTPSCYDEEIPRLMDEPTNLSMEDAFAVTRLIQQKDPKYAYCHVLGHKLSFKETSKDLSKWKDVVARCPTTMCNNGCQHGALTRRFNSEILTDALIKEIRPDLSDVCEPRGKWNPVEVEQSMCYHALGHLAMFVTNANITKSVDLCQTIGSKPDGRNYVQTCTEGTLMTVYQPLEAEDRALVKDIAPTAQSMPQFCSRFTGETFHACRRESWPLFREQIHTPDGLVKFCSYTTDVSEQKKCYATALNIIAVILVMDDEQKVEKIADFCRKLHGKTRDLCFASSARRLIQVDPKLVSQALGICKLAEEDGLESSCYNELIRFSTITYHEGSKEITAYCKKFPAQWVDQCLRHEVRYD